MENRIKLWVGVGAYVLTSASPAVLTGAPRAGQQDATQWRQANTVFAAAPAIPIMLADATRQTEGGEGGEGGEAGTAGIMASFTDAAGEDERFVARLMMMRAHLRVAWELGESGHADQAAPHVAHPLAEVYETIEEDLERRHLAPFEDRLEDLIAASEAGQVRDVLLPGIDGVLVRLDLAAATVVPWRRNYPEFVLKVALALLKQAALEYDEAVRDGEIVNVAEYQDGRGFVLTARDLVLRLKDSLESRDKDTYAELSSGIGELLAALPGALPPASPKIDAGAFFAVVSRIELAASSFT